MGNRLIGSTGSQAAETVIPFAPAPKSAVPNDADQLDLAGRTILSLLNKAAGAAEENSRQAINIAQKFSQQLRASEDRIAALEGEVRHHQDRADRAEQWEAHDNRLELFGIECRGGARICSTIPGSS